MKPSADTMLYQDPAVPQMYSAEFGGISLDVDTDRREVKLYVSPGDASDQDYRDAQAVLSRLGIGYGHDAYWDHDVAVMVAYF